MIDELKITNLTTKESVVFKKDNSSFILDDDGVDWGTNTCEISTAFYPKSIGANVMNQRIRGMRPVNIDGWIVADIDRGMMQESEWEEECLKHIEQSTKILSRVINPLDLIRVEADGYYIDCTANESLKVSKEYANNNEVMKGVGIALVSPSGMFVLLDGNTNNSLFSSQEALLHFPLVLDDTVGYELSRFIPSEKMNVKNKGDIQTGGIFTLIAASGDVTNPTITNLANGQKFTVYHTISQGGSLVVDTEQQRVSLVNLSTGETTNLYSVWEYQNDWVQFVVGDNTILYTCEAGAENVALLVECQSKFYTIRSA